MHAVYYDTAYRDWGRVVDALDRIGIRHARDAIFANPAPQSRGWNERYYRNIEAAVARGIRFSFITGRPNNDQGSARDLIAVAGGRLRRAVEYIEGPNEYDASGSPDWADELRAYQRDLARLARTSRTLEDVPVVGPSLVDNEDDLGDISATLDLGNMHPYTGGEPPRRDHVTDQLEDARKLAGDKPVVVTEAGFHNAMNSTAGQPPVPEDIAASYTLRTILQHFAQKIPRTYLYELVDEKPEPAQRDPEQHFGLLRNDFSFKPAAVALQNLIEVLGERRAPDRLDPTGVEIVEGEVESLTLQRADGDHLVVLWDDDVSAWDTATRERRKVPPQDVAVRLDAGRSVSVYRPVRSAEGEKADVADDGRVTVPVGLDPVILRIAAPDR